MKIGTLTLSSIALLSIAAGGTLAAPSQLISWSPEEQIPESIASHLVLEQHTMARSLLQMLPMEQQGAIIERGGFGAEDRAHALARMDDPSARRGVIGVPTEAELDIKDPAFRSTMTDDQLAMLDAMQETIEAGNILPLACFAEDVDPAFIAAVHNLFKRSIATNGSRFQGTDRWTSTATNGAGISQGDPITITYSYVPDGTFIPNLGIGVGSGNSVLFSFFNGIYANDEADWQPLFDQVFARWSELIGVTYVYEPNDDGVNTNSAPGVLGVRGDVRIGAFNLANDTSNGGTLAYNNFPNDGDMIFDTDSFYNNTSTNSRRLRNVAAHEHGHGLGMFHVCPISNSKLMEPFVTTSFDGPQLDDILGGQRRYGDLYEPQSDDPSNPPSLGSLGVNDFAQLMNVSIDDNADVDFYRFTLTGPGEINITVAPDADAYLQGPQTQFCNGGALTDYNSIHDLSIAVFEAAPPFSPIASVNATGEGEFENLVETIFTPGDYLIQISGDTTNNIQRYLLQMFVGSAGNCSAADLAAPLGTLNFFDISAYISLFSAGDAAADLAAPFGTLNFFDVSAYITIYNQGCP